MEMGTTGARRGPSFIHKRFGESTMKIFALIAGLVFLVAGVCGFLGKIAMVPMYGVVLAVAGLVFLMYGLSRRRDLVPARGDGSGMRDLGGV
jgi:hypothetical protein